MILGHKRPDSTHEQVHVGLGLLTLVFYDTIRKERFLL